MKKGFFLLFLFIVYIYVVINKSTILVSETSQKSFKPVNTITIDFPTGINSRLFSSILKDYKNEYLITKIDTYKDEFFVSCDEFTICETEIFKNEGDLLNLNYLPSGITIRSLVIVTYYDEIKTFLETTKLNYVLR